MKEIAHSKYLLRVIEFTHVVYTNQMQSLFFTQAYGTHPFCADLQWAFSISPESQAVVEFYWFAIISSQVEIDKSSAERDIANRKRQRAAQLPPHSLAWFICADSLLSLSTRVELTSCMHAVRINLCTATATWKITRIANWYFYQTLLCSINSAKCLERDIKTA